MQKLISRLILAIFISASTYTQSHAQSFELGGSQIEVEVSISNQIIYIHKIQKGQTIYSLARYFKIPVQDLMIINDITAGQIISIGSEIKVPIDKNKLLTPLEKQSEDWISIIYKVKKGETLYSMSNSYFPQRMDHLIARNNIQSFYVKSEQELVIGWWGNGNGKGNEIVIEPEVEVEKIVAETETVDPNVNTTNPNTEIEVKSEGEESVEVATQAIDENIQAEIVETETVENESEALDENYKEEFVLDIITQVMQERDTAPQRPETLETPDNIETQGIETSSINTNERAIPAAPHIDNSVRNSSDSEESIANDIEDGMISELDTDDEALDIENESEELIPVQMETLVSKSKTGIGLWDKNDPDATSLLVFHRTAKINSLVKLHNPVTNRTVTAEVIGHIIDKIYPADIDIVVTKGVALNLGAMDSRFRVEIKYTESILN